MRMVEVLDFVPEDPDCGFHSIWLARCLGDRPAVIVTRLPSAISFNTPPPQPHPGCPLPTFRITRMDLSLILPMSAFALAASLSPGPVNMVCLGSGTRHGVRASLGA
jgi:hypothetical protein